MPHPVAFVTTALGAYAVWSVLNWLLALYLAPVYATDDAGSGRWKAR